MNEQTKNLDESIRGKVTRNRKRLMGFGILMLLLGIAGVYMSSTMTMTSMLIFGIFIMISGVVFLVESFSSPEWKGKLLFLLLALIYIVAGIMIVAFPAESAIWFTLFLAVMFVFVGIMRIVAGFLVSDEISNWKWMLFYGMLDILLGVMIYVQWPVSGLWVIGLFVSIELIIHGLNAIMLSREVKKFQKIDV